MIVVDTSIIGYLYLESERSPLAEKALIKHPHWAAPLLWRSELHSVLALYIRRKFIALEDAVRIMDEAMKLMSNSEYEVASSRVLSLVSRSNCSAYDCEFVALAQDLGVPLVTVGKQILYQFPADAIPLEEFVS